MNDWFHCSKCFTVSNADISFWFTSCGHILCTNCLKLGTGSNSERGEQQHHKKCIVCSKEAGYMAINRHMRADIMDLFKPPRVILREYMQKLHMVISFQAHHRNRLAMHRQEQYNKMAERLRVAEGQIEKSALLERTLLAEKDNLLAELQKEKLRAGSLTSLLNSTQHSEILNNTRTSNGNSIEQQQRNFTPGFVAGRNGIRSIPLKPVVGANYTAGAAPTAHHRSTGHRNSFIPASASFFHSRTPASFTTGRITKGPILPPSLDIHNSHKPTLGFQGLR